MSGAAFNDTIHQPVRLKLMAVLDAEPGGGALDFARLKAISEATDGNLGAHLNTLGSAGFIEVSKVPVGKRTRTLVAITASGRAAFRAHIFYLQELVEAVGSRT